MIKTSSNGVTTFYENGERIFYCRCGETHRGDDIYEGHEHMCYHNETLLIIPEQTPPIELQVICPSCGKSWRASTKNQEELDVEEAK